MSVHISIATWLTQKFGQLKGALSKIGSLGALSASPWVSWNFLGALSGLSWGSLGALLGPSWDLLSSLGAILGFSWSSLGSGGHSQA